MGSSQSSTYKELMKNLEPIYKLAAKEIRDDENSDILGIPIYHLVKLLKNNNWENIKILNVCQYFYFWHLLYQMDDDDRLDEIKQWIDGLYFEFIIK